MTYRPVRLESPSFSISLILLALWMAFLVASSMPAIAAQGGNSSTGTQTITLKAYGVTIAVPTGWSHRQYANVDELLNVPAEKMATMAPIDRENAAKIRVSAMVRATHAMALDRLAYVAAEYTAAPTYLTIDGWPALQRQVLVPKPQPGRPDQEEAGVKGDEPGEMLLLVTTAVAAGNSIFRLDGTVAADSPAATVLVQQMKDIGKQLRFKQPGDAGAAPGEMEQLRKNVISPSPAMAVPKRSSPSGTSEDASSAGAGAASLNTGIGDEPEIAVSTNGQNIVIAAQFQGVSSQDGGQNFSAPFNFPKATGGDSSLAFGRSGNFYEGTIGTVTTTNDAQVVNIATSLATGFTFGTNPFTCTSSTCAFVGTNNANGVPDQEHIAADRFNAGPAPKAGDQVYFVWRKPNGYGMTCSSDSGATWSKAIFKGDGAADFPRVSVGQDGSVYVVYVNGGNIELDKYTSCANGLVQSFQGAVVASGTTQPNCPIAGLDRCGGETGQNDLRSPVVAVDDTNANHIYVGFASNTPTTTNENVFVTDSNSGGADKTWSKPTQVNNSIPAHRFMPWTCSAGGTAYVSWYDRRNATATTNDNTDYFGGSVAPNLLGTLTAAPDYQINALNTADPQCGSGAGGNWPFAPAAKDDSTSCFVQPQLAGTCSTNGQRCDYNTTVCPGGGTCQTGRGTPKYGDYNGNACAAGRFYTIFASATSQPNAPAAGINLFFSKKLVCCDPQIQVPSPLSLSACTGASANTTANVCNTGKADLEVDTISFSKPNFFVSNPSSGFPVIISPDSCFPFQVNFFATGTASTSATMTIATNDPVTPSATVQVTGIVSTPQIETAIANSGNFGGVCIGAVGDLPLTINNAGQCTLSVKDILSTDPEYSTANVINYPLSVAAGTSTTVQLAFKPTLPTGNKPSTIDVLSNDPVNPNFNIAVTGLSEAPLVSVTGTTNFGNVCAGVVQDETFKVCNLPVAGTCQLNVTNVTLSAGCKDFTIISNPFPEYLGAEVCGNVVVQFTPTSDGPKTCNLIVTSSDPATPIDVVPLTGTTPIPSISLSTALAFPPVVEGNGKCAVTEPFPVRNTGICPLTVTGVTLGPPNPEDYGLVDLPNQTNVLPPGGALSQGGFGVRFQPIELNRNVDSAVDVTYISDPILGTKTTLARNLCGEGVFVGARVLVTEGGVPVSTVDRIQLIQVSTNTVIDNVVNATLKTITPKIAKCAPFQFQREYGTVSDPKALAPGTYQVKVTLTIAGKQQVKTVTFTDNSCGFAHPVVVAF